MSVSTLGTLVIRVTPHEKQRYSTLGDWQLGTTYTDQQGNTWSPVSAIQVSQFGDWRYEALCAVHELVEMLWCRAHGVDTETVDLFDKAYRGDGEPGDDPAAPYHEGHALGEAVERLVALGLRVSWAEYCEACEQVEGGDDASQAKEVDPRQGAGNAP